LQANPLIALRAHTHLTRTSARTRTSYLRSGRVASAVAMAKSQYEYVKTVEMADELLPHCWIVCRVDGVAFTKSEEQQTVAQRSTRTQSHAIVR
jgi:hypothetical protein